MADTAPILRRRLTARGLVQGVGFRPFVRRLARRHGLAGFVRNGPEGAVIEAEGGAEELARFAEELRLLAPPLAVIASLVIIETAPRGGTEFVIQDSAETGEAAALIPPDVATCHACLAELRDPADRRHGYPFLNCTDCGPRYSIVDALPYDRPATSMRDFVLCPACRAEYEDPDNRRYHAQPVACPACGPRLGWLDAVGVQVEGVNPLAAATELLARGGILALKGIGGFHLACDACDAGAVSQLRRRKGRPDKPLAVMARDLAGAAELACLSERERDLLEHWRRPILVCRPRRPSPLVDEVFGCSRQLGLFLPYSPLHHLLLERRAPLVMTSGNRSGEPIARDNGEAAEMLRGIADAFLVHDRGIHHASDDSVARLARGNPVLLRRGRGWVPQPVLLPREGPCVLALGADLKGACCVTRGALAFPGPALGDLENPRALDELERSALHMVELLGVTPNLVVHDLHPDYQSTRLAHRLARRLDAPLLAVQHHHAHALSALAEHAARAGLDTDTDALALCLDGAGHGSDGTIWGGEALRVDGLSWSRWARLWPLPQPGGDLAARQPWRMGLAALAALRPAAQWPRAWRGLPPLAAADGELAERVLQQAERPGACPLTSSAGRLLDAVAALLGVCQRMSFEGQAAMMLEDLAREGAAAEPYPLPWIAPSGEQGPWEIDSRPLLAALLEDIGRGRRREDCARAAHLALADFVCEAARRARDGWSAGVVALSGGVFQNQLLAALCADALERDDFRVLLQEQVPPNDEGLALGQAWAGLLHLSGAPDAADRKGVNLSVM
jgi:hydrogenase maturation protein HypF